MREDERPNPDELLQALPPATTNGRGHLKIFFGACAGVGKTYAMLSAAQEKREDGVEILVGLVETHGRKETQELVKDLTVLPRLEMEHRGVKLTEFDLDAALKLKPAMILVDELAHTNAPGLRHAKRWRDVEELLAAGIDVYTTLNVQHVESLNDIVAGITGISVRETVPDSVFDGADEVSLVDLPSDDLIERLQEGKVYTTDLGKKRAAENFFRRENLIALRELALRRVAERLDAQSAEGLALPASRRPAAERLAVCIGPGSLTPRLLRSAKRLADGLRASWIAIYVENDRHFRLSHAAQLQLERNFRLVEEMGGKVVMLQGGRAVHTIIHYAQSKGITKIIAGKPPKSWLQDILEGSLVNDLIRHSGDIDVFAVTGSETIPALTRAELPSPAREWKVYVAAVLVTACVTALGMPLRGSIEAENLVMLYLLGIVILAAQFGRAASFAGSILSFLAYNFFFSPPYYSFEINNFNDVLTASLLLITGFLASLQTSRLQMQKHYFRDKERNTAALYAMSQELAGTRGRDSLITVIRRHLEKAQDGTAMIWFPDAHGDMEAVDAETKSDMREEMAIRWALDHTMPAGQGTTTMPSARGYYLPLRGSSGAFGVLGFIPASTDQPLTPEQRVLLETFASLAAAALERAQVAEVAEAHKVEAESEKLRNALLSSVSHDLRTPLAFIKGVISSLIGDRLDNTTQAELLASAHDEVTRLERVVSNLLDVTRLESEEVKLSRDYYFVPELVGSALKQVESLLKGRQVKIQLPEDLPALRVDGLLTEQVLVNLLENAAKYTPAVSTVTISARTLPENWIEMTVEDDGPGIPLHEEERIFDKFTAFPQEGARSTGLGLTICRAIIRAHAGVIAASHRPGGGARFVMKLPSSRPPQLEGGV